MAKNALVAIADGIEELEAVAIIDILRRANIDVTVASANALQIKASRGVNLIADKLIADCGNDQFDLITLPGGMPGAENLRDNKYLAAMLKSQNSQGKLIAAICASPAVVLLPLGLLDGKTATCHPGFLAKLPADIKADKRLIVDGNCVTSQGPGTAIEFALKLVELLCDKKTAENIAAGMVSAG